MSAHLVPLAPVAICKPLWEVLKHILQPTRFLQSRNTGATVKQMNVMNMAAAGAVTATAPAAVILPSIVSHKQRGGCGMLT